MRPLHRLRMVVASLLLGLAAPALQGADVPDDVPQDCHPVYGRALTLLREFDAGLSPKDRSLARRVVDQGASQGRAAPQAYEYLGAAAALRGNYAIALWASLNAGRQAWRSATVTNIGVYLFYLGRLDEAERFLNCARKMNPRSPYALEALAMIALKRKN